MTPPRPEEAAREEIDAGNKIGLSTKVVITTIQRLDSILRAEPELDPEIGPSTVLTPDDLTTLP